MRYMKFALWMVAAMCFAACASNQNTEDADIPRTSERDPIIAQEAAKNEKLMRQSEEEMLESMKVPDIVYEYDSIRPPDYAYDVLDKLANILISHPSMKLIIEGNTDMVGNKEYNYWLGASRAAAMKSYLVSRGVLADRIRIHSYGSDRPLTLDTSAEGRMTNRRVHFVLTTRTWQSVY